MLEWYRAFAVVNIMLNTVYLLLPIILVSWFCSEHKYDKLEKLCVKLMILVGLTGSVIGLYKLCLIKI